MTKIKMFFISLLLMLPILALGFVIAGNGSESSPTTPLDVLVFSGASLQLYDETSTEYNSGKRMQLLGSGATVIDSKLYGEYRIVSSGVDLEFANDGSDGKCNSSVSYKFVGSFEHTKGWFEDLTIDSDNSYYCPNDFVNGVNKFSMSVYSQQTGTFTFTQNSAVIAIKLDVVDGYWNTKTIDLTDLLADALNNEGIYINGAYLSSKNIDNSSFVGEIQNNAGNVQLGGGNLVTSKISNFNKVVNKNIELLTRGKNGKDDTNIVLSSLGGDSLYYYNYEEKSYTKGTNSGKNKGKILELKSSNNIIEVDGQKTIILKGGNIYINSDIKNTDDSSSILVIVAKRDSTNNKNGGNIYIDPSVTNIDAILIADGSILSYNSTSGIITGANALRKQLLIYGSVATKNVIGSNNAPYGSDDYINGTKNIAGTNRYDLLNLRSFQAILSDAIVGSCSKTGDLVAIGGNNTTATKDAFAGRKDCYISEYRNEGDTGIDGLRSTEKLTPVVILYNPIAQTNPPDILKTR